MDGLFHGTYFFQLDDLAVFAMFGHPTGMIQVSDPFLCHFDVATWGVHKVGLAPVIIHLIFGLFKINQYKSCIIHFRLGCSMIFYNKTIQLGKTTQEAPKSCDRPRASPKRVTT